jgi:uncharacterized protein (TIGR00290 family)
MSLDATSLETGHRPTVDPREPVVLGWSGGKDSALALYALRSEPTIRVEALLTTLTDQYDRVSMHGVRHRLLTAQAAAVGLPVTEARIPPGASNAAYEQAFNVALASYRARGVRRIAFGDLFLADVRAYRERQLAALDMTGLFPLWERDTGVLAREFIALGFRAILVCVDAARLDASFAGRPFDHDLLRDLPPGVDPCGENGEFHTFVTDGPIFNAPVTCTTGVIVQRDGYVFCDLVPSEREDQVSSLSSR